MNSTVGKCIYPLETFQDEAACALDYGDFFVRLVIWGLTKAQNSSFLFQRHREEVKTFLFRLPKRLRKKKKEQRAVLPFSSIINTWPGQPSWRFLFCNTDSSLEGLLIPISSQNCVGDKNLRYLLNTNDDNNLLCSYICAYSKS